MKMEDLAPSTELCDNTANARENISRLRKHTDPEAVIDFYEKWIQDSAYDKQLKEGYGGPIASAETLVRHLGEKTDISVIDVGAGSGFVGEELQKRGFTNIDAVEPSGGMVKVAKEKNVYKNIFQTFFTENMDTIKSNHYDALISCGSMGVGHIPLSALTEFARIVKPGGVFIIITGLYGMASQFTEMNERIEELTRAGQLLCVEKSDLPTYYFGRTGSVTVCKVTG